VAEKDIYLRFARVILPHLGDALSLAQCLTGTRAGAEDLVQEAFIRAFLGLDGFAKGNARAWVLTMVFHAWLSRDATLPPFDPQAHNGLALATIAPGPNDASAEIGLDHASDRALVEQSIAALPAVFRETLLLRVQGLSYHKISEIIGVPVGTVMSRLARARRRLKQTTADRHA
jgi:RNA polymerase sigma factor (sigma-70 family)